MLFIFLNILLIIGIPLSISFIIYITIKRFYPKAALRIGIITFFIPYILLAIFIYIASNPNEDFYKEEFYEVTGFNIPNSTYFNYKEATLPNLYGEYISAAAITLSKNDFNTLLKEIRESKKLTDQSDLESNTYRKIKIKTGNQKYIYYASSKIKNNYYFIGFCTDQKTVIIHSIKS